MENSVKLCYQEYPDIKGICICCASQNGFLINATTCKHVSFLENYLSTKLDYDSLRICVICHHILKKIEIFKQQVQDSIAYATEQYHTLEITKLNNLQYTRVNIDDTTVSQAETVKVYTHEILYSTETTHKIEIKVEQDTPDFKYDLPLQEIEIKVEPDTSYYKDDIPLQEIEPAEKRLETNELKSFKKKRTEIGKYEGKIRTITLTGEELEEEREKSRDNEAYKRLPFKCQTCIVGFDHEVTLNRHMDTRHKETGSELKCEICLSVLGSKMSLDAHNRRHMQRHECVACGRKFHLLRSAIRHYDDAHAPPGASTQSMYTCQLCGYNAKSHRVFCYHMDKHKQKPKCEQCGKSFVNTQGLRVHLYTVHEPSGRMYRCDVCDKSYTGRSGLFAHTRSAHGNDASRAFCTVCNTQYRSEQLLKIHLRTHSNHVSENDKKFICDECGKRFVQKHTLRAHINWAHMKIVGHRCDQCSKMFKNGSQLRKHTKYVHEKERPPRNKICDHCGRGFTTQAILQSHIRTHTGERPHCCAQCPARFAHSAALYTHKKLLHGQLAKL